jgi:hypothetical protein
MVVVDAPEPTKKKGRRLSWDSDPRVMSDDELFRMRRVLRQRIEQQKKVVADRKVEAIIFEQAVKDEERLAICALAGLRAKESSELPPLNPKYR